MSVQPLNIMENLAIVPDPTIIDKGFYLPSLTTKEMVAFIPSLKGVVIFNNETNLLMTFINNQWVSLITSNNNAPIIPGYTSDPVNPAFGTIYYNADLGVLKIFVGAWGRIGIVW